MIKFLLMFKNDVILNVEKIKKLSEFSVDTSRLYFEILFMNEYITEYQTNTDAYKKYHNDPIYNHKYCLDHKGRIFLHKHNLI